MGLSKKYEKFVGIIIVVVIILTMFLASKQEGFGGIGVGLFGALIIFVLFIVGLSLRVTDYLTNKQETNIDKDKKKTSFILSTGIIFFVISLITGLASYSSEGDEKFMNFLIYILSLTSLGFFLGWVIELIQQFGKGK